MTDVERAGSAALARDARGIGLHGVHAAVPAGGAAAAVDRGMGAAGAAGARRCDSGGRTGVPPEIRLRHGTAAEDDRLDVAFDKAGDKRVLDRFVEKV